MKIFIGCRADQNLIRELELGGGRSQQEESSGREGEVVKRNSSATRGFLISSPS